MWEPLLEQDCSHFFDKSCFEYDHCLDTVLDGLEVIKIGEDKYPKREDEDGFVSIHNSEAPNNFLGGYTALEDDLFVPKGYYSNEGGGIPVIFDSGCTHALSPFESDFVGDITPINKLMNGLGATVNVVGVGTVGWSFRDDYGVMRRVLVKAYIVPASKVRLFSPNSISSKQEVEHSP